eukprot:119619-Prorocentrum_minimum.AAC.1
MTENARLRTAARMTENARLRTAARMTENARLRRETPGSNPRNSLVNNKILGDLFPFKVQSLYLEVEDHDPWVEVASLLPLCHILAQALRVPELRTEVPGHLRRPTEKLHWHRGLRRDWVALREYALSSRAIGSLGVLRDVRFVAGIEVRGWVALREYALSPRV